MWRLDGGVRSLRAISWSDSSRSSTSQHLAGKLSGSLRTWLPSIASPAVGLCLAPNCTTEVCHRTFAGHVTIQTSRALTRVLQTILSCRRWQLQLLKQFRGSSTERLQAAEDQCCLTDQQGFATNTALLAPNAEIPTHEPLFETIPDCWIRRCR